MTPVVPDRKQVFGDDEEDWDNEVPVAGGGHIVFDVIVVFVFQK